MASLISISSAFACQDKKTMIQDQKNIVVCYSKKEDSYLSVNCPSVKECFLKKKITLNLSPNQAPGFSLCLQLQGEPFYAQVVGLNKKVPFCELHSSFVDQEALMVAYYLQN